MKNYGVSYGCAITMSLEGKEDRGGIKSSVFLLSAYPFTQNTLRYIEKIPERLLHYAYSFAFIVVLNEASFCSRR